MDAAKIVKRSVEASYECKANKLVLSVKQCFVSGLDTDSIRTVDPDPDPGGQK
jgi:hypothetical protein